jgi:uncharacterized protein involved in response to NO
LRIIGRMLQLSVFATAFRIFFLSTALHAVAVITIWLLKLRGHEIAAISTAPVYWHTYEMVFGFGRAAIFGFLFTAGQHWSGQQLLTRRSLTALFLLWLTGRFSFFLPYEFSVSGFAIDSAANVLALYSMWPLMQPQQKHNQPVVWLFIAYAAAQVVASGAVLAAGLSEIFLPAVKLALLCVVFLVAIIAGRVLPFFASVVIAGDKPRILPKLEKAIWPLTLVTLGAFSLAPLHDVLTKMAAAACLLAAILHAIRWVNWRPQATWRMPILAILYAGYLFLIIGFALLGLALLQWVPSSVAWHMLGLGAAGVFIFGMMTRVALGHTGRPIKATVLVNIGYFALCAALPVRVVLPLFGYADKAYLFAAIFWILSFTLYLIKYTPILLHARVDGRPG